MLEARIIKLSDLKKTPQQREAERLLAQLGPDKAVEVTLKPSDSPRGVSNTFRRAAAEVGKEIRVRRRADKLYITLLTKKEA